MHLFWDCPKVTEHWSTIEQFCIDFLDKADFSPAKWLLATFDYTVVNMISIIVKKTHFHSKIPSYIPPPIHSFETVKEV